jgi:hypothetical protein
MSHGKLLASYVSIAITEQEYHNKLITYVMFQVFNLRNTNCSVLSYVVSGVSVRRHYSSSLKVFVKLCLVLKMSSGPPLKRLRQATIFDIQSKKSSGLFTVLSVM